MHLHQDVDVKLVGAANSREVTGAQLRAQHIRALRLDQRHRGFDFSSRIGKVAGVSIEVREVVVNHRSRHRVGGSFTQRQRVAVVLQRALRVFEFFVDTPDVGQQVSLFVLIVVRGRQSKRVLITFESFVRVLQ